MPLDFSTTAVTKKNTLADTGAWLTLLKIDLSSVTGEAVDFTDTALFEFEDEDVDWSGTTLLRLVNNIEEIEWNDELYHPADFKLGTRSQSRDGSVPQVSLQLLDLDRILTPAMKGYDGGVGADVYIYLVHSDNLTETTAEFDEHYEIMSTTVNSMNLISVSLGMPNPMSVRIPQDRYLKDHCRYKEFGGTLCGYADSPGQKSCDRRFDTCIAYGNTARFGGFPGMGASGYYA